MGIVALLSNLIKDFSDVDGVGPDPCEARGRLVIATGTISNEADDSDTSTYHLCDIPSYALLDPSTFFDVTSDGFAAIAIGTLTDSTAFVDQTQATENLITPVAQGGADHGKRLWEVLGLSEDPGGMIGIYKHAAADAAGAGSMPFRLAYIAN
ncbi:hypothetical protein [Pacificibacter marinus]|uniref:hypothetical protein n=1 Tax=Pacificibacter marinus TaxID=658057 RepID=UPI001C066FFB|nr:hypothetical protein [Pacificibacter marinus]MBU2867016.1 hypothetical protein [Pacificibacter marinus]